MRIYQDIKRRVGWLVFLRIVFTFFLAGVTLFIKVGKYSSPAFYPLASLFPFAFFLLLISLAYAAFLPKAKNLFGFAYLQLVTDTLVISLICFYTGSLTSVFTFLYLLVIIAASQIILRKGSVIIAILGSIQYVVIVFLEYYGVITPPGLDRVFLASSYEPGYVIYRTFITVSACYAVSLLSSLLVQQVEKVKMELSAMEKHLKRVDKMAFLGEMAAGLAHEIKNPLASLSGSIQLLRDDMDHDPDQDKLMRIALREADRLGVLVNDFLMFAKPRSGTPETVDLTKIIRENIDLFKKDPLCRETIVLKSSLQDGVEIETDAGHLRQILWNLLINAAESIENDGYIKVSMYLNKGAKVIVKVKDSGCGMDQNVMASAFDPFFTTKPSGTGLGLSIVLRMVESCGGILDVKSEKGKGSLFTIIFKRKFNST